jgi:uncharacterized protein (UPF0276 family)
MVCPVKVNLLAHYRILTDAYSVAVSDLHGSMCASRGALIDLLKLTRNARALLKAARDNFKKHVSEHGC